MLGIYYFRIFIDWGRLETIAGIGNYGGENECKLFFQNINLNCHNQVLQDKKKYCFHLV